MRRLRRSVLLGLLLTVPFQAALGATGLHCSAAAHHAQEAPSVAHLHDSAMVTEHHHDDGAFGDHDDSVAEPGSSTAHGAAGECKICSECCFTAAAILPSQSASFPPDTHLWVSKIGLPDIVSRPGDGLFRPPRTTAV